MVNLICATKFVSFRRLTLRLAMLFCFGLILAPSLDRTALAQDQKTGVKQTGAKQGRSEARTTRPDSSKIEGLESRSFRLILPPQFDTGMEASLESGRVPMTPDESLGAAKKRWTEAEEFRATGTAQSLRVAMSKYEDALRLLRSAGRVSEPGDIAHTLNQLASISDTLGDSQQAIHYYSQSLPLWRAANDRQSEAATLTRLGRVHNLLGDKQQAQHFFDQARLIVQTSNLMRRVGEENRAAAATFNLGKLFEEQGQPQQALQQYQRALSMWREAKDKKGEASALNGLGSLATRAGQFDQAIQFFQQSLPLWRATGDKRGEAVTLSNLGYVAEAQGRRQRALDLYLQSLPVWRDVNDKIG